MSESSPLMRRRWHRVRMVADIGLEASDSGERTLASLRDLSVSGCRLVTRETLPLGAKYQLAFQLEDNKKPLRLQASVAWAKSPTGDPAVAGDEIEHGLHFIDPSDEDKEQIRAQIDQRIWSVLSVLNDLQQLTELSDLEKMGIASVAFELQVNAGEIVPPAELIGTLVIVRDGVLKCEELDSAAGVLAARKLGRGGVCGSFSIDPRGVPGLRLTGVENAELLCIPDDGFAFLSESHPEIAVKLLSLQCVTLMDRLFEAELAHTT